MNWAGDSKLTRSLSACTQSSEPGANESINRLCRSARTACFSPAFDERELSAISAKLVFFLDRLLLHPAYLATRTTSLAAANHVAPGALRLLIRR